MRPDTTQSARRFGCTLGAAIAAVCLSSVVHAQEAAANKTQAADLEEVVVTGSYIRRDVFDNATPLTIVTREDFVNAGASTILDIARYLPVNTGSILYQEAGALPPPALEQVIAQGKDVDMAEVHREMAEREKNG